MTTRADYEAFLRSKMITVPERGISIDASAINPLLKPHQAAIVRWALRKGNAAIFAAFGLGKTFMQLEIARLIQREASGKFLIVAPLGVRQEFARDAQKLGIEIQFVRRFEECERDGIFLTNYETIRDSKMDPRKFTGCSLDEAAILRGFGGTKTFREFMRVFENGQVRYKFVATATPSPNEYIELLAYAAFLDVMDVSQAKTRFFKRDSTKADNLTLHKHKEREFFLWCSGWGIFLQKPSDLGPGYSDEGYNLPEMEIHWHELPSDHTQSGYETSGQGRLVRNSALGVTHAAREKKDSLSVRVERMVQIVSQSRLFETLPHGASSRVERMVSEKQATSRATASRLENGEPGLLPQLLSNPQGALCVTESQTLSGEQRGVEAAQSEMETREPRQIQSCSTGSRGEKSREANRQESAVVRGKQRTIIENEPQEQIKTLRADEPSIHGSVRVTKAALQNMQLRNDITRSGTENYASDSRNRSRSQDRNISRHSVPQMQCGPGSLSGQSENPQSGSTVLAQFIAWCDRNDEQKAIDAALDKLGISYSSLYGSMPLEERERSIERWRDRETIAFVSKPVLYGAGINLQQCSTAIFVGIGYKFSEFRQAIARVHRFLQTDTVRIHIIYTEAEREVRRVLEEKWEKHKELVAQMSAIIREYGLATNALAQEFGRTLGVERQEVQGTSYCLTLNDSVLETMDMSDASVHLVLSSIPFATQYEYSPSYNDFGHSDDNEQFWAQMDFLIPELYRVLEPGRACLIHVKDRIVPGGLNGMGFQTVYPFHVDAIRNFCRYGFGYMGMVTIVTDVVRENGQTYRLGWSEQCKDGSKMGVGMPEYLLIFRKPPTDSSRGYADRPVIKQKAEYSRHRWQIDAHGFHRSNGDRLLTRDDIRNMPHERIFKLFRQHSLTKIYDYEEHVGLGEALEVCAHCGHIHLGIKGEDDEGKVCGQRILKGPSEIVSELEARHGYNWKLSDAKAAIDDDICHCPRYDSALPKNFMLLQPQSWHPDVWTDVTRMLSLNSAQAAKGKEMHLCPMQYDLADRAITQFSMKGETVYDPFGGLGTVALRAIKLGRKGVACELSPSYFRDACFYCEAAERQMAMPSLFDLLGGEHEEEAKESEAEEPYLAR